jgi:hypothetical protein
MFHSLIGIDQAKDMWSVPAVDPDVLEAWLDHIPGAIGPSLDDLKFDWHGGKKSLWNIKLVDMLSHLLMHESYTKWHHLPKYPFYYYEDVVWQKFSNFRTDWKKAQSRKIGFGDEDYETQDQIFDRLHQKDQMERKAARQNTRRHQVSFNCARKN